MGSTGSARDWIGRAQQAAARGDTQEACRCYREAGTLVPYNARVWIALGRSAAMLHHYDESRRAFERAQDIASGMDALEATFGIGFSANGLADYAVAEAAFQRVLPAMRDESHPLLADTLYGLAFALLRTGRAEDAARLLEECVLVRSRFPAAWQLLALSLWRSRQLWRLWRIIWAASSKAH